MSVTVLMKFPDSMKSEIEAKGIRPWTKGGRYRSMKEAMLDAKAEANKMNMPIELCSMGTSRVIYPDVLNDLGYGRDTRVN